MALGLDFPRLDEATDTSSASVAVLVMLPDRLKKKALFSNKIIREGN